MLSNNPGVSKGIVLVKSNDDIKKLPLYHFFIIIMFNIRIDQEKLGQRYSIIMQNAQQ